MFRIPLFILCLALFGFTTEQAKAQSCTATATDILFGNIDVVTGSSYSASGQVSVRCTGKVGKTMRICIGIGSGGGGSTGGAPRNALKGTESLQYNLYQNAGMTTIYGAYNWPYPAYKGMQYIYTVPSTGTFTIVSNVYGKVMPSQTTRTPGLYVSNFAMINSYIGYDYNSTISCATTGGGFATTTSMTFKVSATVIPSCIVTATDMDFGMQGLLAGNVDATTTLKARCSNGTPYNIALDGGLAGASSGGVRKMLNAGGTAAVLYNLFRDVSRVQPWGTVIGADTLAGTGTGLSQAVTVYGRIAPQVTPAPGSYSDLITVTMTY